MLLMRSSRSADLRSLLSHRDDYPRRSLTPLFLRELPRSKSICSARSHLLKLPMKEEDEKKVKSARRREYDQMLKTRSRCRSPTPPPRPPTRPIVLSMLAYLSRKRAALLIQSCFRLYSLRKRHSVAIHAAVTIQAWFRRQRAKARERKVAKWLFLVCLFVRTVAARHQKARIAAKSRQLAQTSLTIQTVFRAFLSSKRLSVLKQTPKPVSGLTKRKTLVEDFKHFVLSSKIEQAVMAFRWNLEVSKKNKLLLQGLKEFHRVAACVLQRSLRPALLQLKSHYEECERARKYRPSKQRQSQRFLIRDRKTIQSLSHKLALVLSTKRGKRTTQTPGVGLIEKLKLLVSTVIGN